NSSFHFQASLFAHLSGLSYSVVQSPTVCLPSLFASHFSSSHSLSACTYALSLHDALPIFVRAVPVLGDPRPLQEGPRDLAGLGQDRKSTRLNSSHVKSSYAVFCLKKKRSLVF